MKKRISALILALLMISSVTACKKKPTDGSSSEDNTSLTQSTVSDSSENSDSSAEESVISDTSSVKSSSNASSKKTVSTVGDQSILPKMNLSNKKVKLILHYDLTQSSNIVAYAKKAYGLDVECEVVAYNQLQTRFINETMSGKGPDLYPCMSPAMINAGYGTSLDNLFDWNSELWKGVKDYTQGNKWRGHIWSVCTQTARDSYIFFNKSMFKEAGETYPSELYKQGKWTWDTFYELAGRMTLDPKNTGTPTQYGIVCGEMADFLYTTGTPYVSMNASGRPVNNMKSAAVQRFINFYVKLAKSTCSYKGSSDAKTAFAQGEVAMCEGRSWYRSAWADLIKKDLVGSAPLPKDPQADKHYIVEGAGQAWSISSKASNPSGAVALCNVMRMMALDKDIIKQGQDEDIKANTLTKNLIADMELKNQCAACPSEWVFSFGYTSYVGDIMNRPLNGEPWSTVAAEVSDAVDFYIEEAMTATPD